MDLLGLYRRSESPIEDWYQDLSEEAQLQFDSVLKNNCKIELSVDWIGFRGFLRGKLKIERIWELGFRADKRQYRILGIFGARKQAVLLIGCYHKGRNYTPAEALDTAAKRANDLREGKAALYERQINTDS